VRIHKAAVGVQITNGHQPPQQEVSVMAQNIVHDNRTEAEKRYDAQRDGSLYVNTPLLPVEEQAINIIHSRDEAHRQERLAAVLHRIATMDEPEQREALGYMEGVLDGLTQRADLSRMVPGYVNDVPLDLMLGCEIMAAIERNKQALGITQDQVYAISAFVTPPIMKYLLAPARRAEIDEDERNTGDEEQDEAGEDAEDWKGLLDAYQSGWKEGRAALIEQIQARLDSLPEDGDSTAA
jgi:hypothetical protein